VSPWFTRIALFLALFVAFPFPMFGLDGVRVPAARFVQLAGALVGLVVVEGDGGMATTFAGLFAVHAVVYIVVLGFFVWALWKFVLSRLPYRLRDHITVITVTLLILIGTYDQLYETRFHHTSSQARLSELYR
jgi:hypothetical protein